MRCPNCASLDTQVKDSRPTEDSSVIRRRRVCLACNFRFTTFERVQLRELVVIKRNGRRVPFDRDKLLRSVQIALRKRPVEPERIDQAVSKIVRELESQGESEISSETVGEMVMEALRALDDVAYVRFASVYRNFREAKDFEAVLDELSGEDEGLRRRWQGSSLAALRGSAQMNSYPAHSVSYHFLSCRNRLQRVERAGAGRAKCETLRVTTVRPCSRAVAAIARSSSRLPICAASWPHRRAIATVIGNMRSP